MAAKIVDIHETPEFMDEVNRYTAIKAEIEEVSAAIAEASHNRGRAAPGDPIRAAAEAYLSGTVGAPVVAPPSADDEVRALVQRKAVLEQALAIQQGRYERARIAVQDEASRAVRPEYERLMRSIADQLAALSQAVERAEALVEPLKRANKFSPRILPECEFRHFRARQEYTAANRLLNELAFAYGIEVAR